MKIEGVIGTDTKGQDRRDVKLDPNTHAVLTTENEHHEIHDGEAFLLIYSALKNDTELVELRVQTPNSAKLAHMEIIFESAIASTVKFWKDTTKTHVANNAIVPMNRHFEFPDNSGLTVCHTPGGSQAGDPKILRYIGAADVSGKITVGGDAGGRKEFVLKRNSAYLFHIVSRADNNALTITLDWYEHTAKDSD